MAATPFDPSHLGTNPFDIYTDASIIKNHASGLPGGACNFVDLSPGANGARCGCRRFWSRCAVGGLAPDQTHWCMCNHHACYHEDGGRDELLPEPNVPGQENERPRTGRAPLSPVIDVGHKTPTNVPGMDFSNFISPGGALSFIQNRPEEIPSNPGIPPSTHAGTSIPDTLRWDHFIQSQPAAHALPPIPSQCLMPSQTASTTSSAQARYLRPFAGKGLQTLSGVPGSKLRPPLQDKPPEPRPAVEPQGNPALGDSFVFVTQDDNVPNTLPADTPTQFEPRAQSQSGVSRRAFKNLADTVGGHEQRLDRLETVSFSAQGHEECHDKHENADVRMTELETRVEEVERMVNDNGSVISRSSRHDNASVVSASSNATSRPTHSQELYSQVQSLQAQVFQLQALMPTGSHPWELEVVFLPFPLKKIWQEGNLFKNEALMDSDEWTQLPMTHSTGTLRSQSPFYGDWVSPDQDTPWLFPKACGDKSVINKRLQSRGLIKTVTVRGSDARSVNSAIHAAFGTIFREMQMYPRVQTPDGRINKFLGLQSSWVPLRKIHKDSRLRFLSPAEMVTPAMWDVQFLSSIMMRSSEPRLFVTHPDAYLQDFQAYEVGWTWQRLKEAVKVSAGEASSPITATENQDNCWAWNEGLDDMHTPQVSMNPPSEKRTVSSSSSQAYFPAVSTFRSSSPTAVRAQSPLLKGRRGSRPPHIRTTSMPVSAPIQISPASARRRVASYGQSRRSSPAVRVSSQSAIMKRRRTRSPSHPRFTPRWTASPSPMPGLDRQGARGTTPFAYATPFSNAPLQEARPMRSSSVAHNAPAFPEDRDPELDIEIYESDSDDDDLYEDDESVDSAEILMHAQLNPEFSSQRWYFPEDDPWPGIEDQDRLSDGENIDPHEPDHQSDASSQPSEYPSTQSAWPGDENGGFQIHEDDDNRP